MARQETNRLLEMIDEGILDPKAVVTMCVKYMSEDDGQPDWHQEWEDFGECSE